MKLYDLHQKSTVNEGAKISQELIQKAMNDPDMTFGFEVEFYIHGVNSYAYEMMARDRDGTSMFGPTKLLKNVTWNDILISFVPLATDDTFETSSMMIGRLHELYQSRTGNDPDMSNREMFDELKTKLKPYHLITLLSVYPKFGFPNIEDENEERAKKIIASGNIIKATTGLKGLDDQPYVMFDDNLEQIPKTDSNVREALYEDVASMIEKIVGGTVAVNLNSKTKGEKPNYNVWNLVGDVSLSTEYDEEDIVGLELVSPILSPNEGVQALNKVFAFISDMRNATGTDLIGFTDNTTGLHINIGHTNSFIDPTKLVFLMGDQYILKIFGREQHSYANSLEKGMVHGIKDPESGYEFTGIKDRRDLLVQLGKELMSNKSLSNDQLEEIIAMVSSTIPKAKNTTVNLSKMFDGYVEFRALGGEGYHKRVKEVMQMVHRFIVILYVAATPEIYRKEYLKKVYNFIMSSLRYLDEPQGTDETH